ncbi:CrcB-like protein-domain-containing protein [Coniella lustricola]|uniref:CrcB-like protein-domain-containing protein n=1 Tax=Coniella lustricola TaxID=2025994 RepID=A0A2T3A5Q1_9PEZI|nr:CrcB-like protein-domain-containing protein [Coniella lustricola]
MRRSVDPYQPQLPRTLHQARRPSRDNGDAAATRFAVPTYYGSLDEVETPPLSVDDIVEPQGLAAAARGYGNQPLTSPSRSSRQTYEYQLDRPSSKPNATSSARHDRASRSKVNDNTQNDAAGVLRQLRSSVSRLSPGSWSSESPSERRGSRQSADNYDVPDSWLNLGEIADTAPVENIDEQPVYRHRDLEDERAGREQDMQGAVNVRTRSSVKEGGVPEDAEEKSGQLQQQHEFSVSRAATQFYTVSYLIFFSFLGTLARLGLQWLTDYPGAPVFPSVWFNFGGSLVMGFLSEDRMLFRNEWGTPKYEHAIQKAKNAERYGPDVPAVDLVAAKKAHQATKKTIPLYIGLATGFCGSFTSFSSFIRDIFLALSNDLAAPGTSTTVPRNGGDSFMALLAVILITVAASLSGLFAGAHLAIASQSYVPSLPYRLTRVVVDKLVVFLAWGCWVGALVLTILPPHNYWRGDATFALLFAPIGCLARFYISLLLNSRNPAFPLGTLTVNVFGTAILGMAYDLQRVPLGGVVGCQALQGIEDGFCGCLTTVSTWVSELASLRRRHAYVYGAASVLTSFAVMVIVLGSLRWTWGFAPLQCVH